MEINEVNVRLFELSNKIKAELKKKKPYEIGIYTDLYKMLSLYKYKKNNEKRTHKET